MAADEWVSAQAGPATACDVRVSKSVQRTMTVCNVRMSELIQRSGA